MLSANEMGAKVGDVIVLMVAGQEKLPASLWGDNVGKMHSMWDFGLRYLSFPQVLV